MEKCVIKQKIVDGSKFKTSIRVDVFFAIFISFVNIVTDFFQIFEKLLRKSKIIKKLGERVW